MHPHPAFAWEDRAGLRAFVADRAFGTICVATPAGPRVAHAPAVWTDAATLGFHLSNANPVTPFLDGASALFVANGPDGYVSPDWYGLGPREVPTWNYVTVELAGTVRRVDRDALAAQIDQLVAEREARTPPPAWTVAKMAPGAHAAMLGAITGFALTVTDWRGTAKLGQTKPAAARHAAAAGLAANGGTAIAAAMVARP